MAIYIGGISPLTVVGVFVLTGGVPGEALLVELDDCLGALDVGLPRWDKVCLVRSLPFDQEHQLTCSIEKRHQQKEFGGNVTIFD